MKAIFCNWTAPFSYEMEISNQNKEYDIPDYELTIQELAVRSAKKYVGKTKLYTDSVGYEFYKKKELLDLWDEIDTDLLNRFTQKYVNLNPLKFWKSGKSIVMGHEPVPYLFLDLDFVIKSDLPSWTNNYDLVHTHWEILRGELFIDEDKIEQIGGMNDFTPNMMVPNTSFVLMNSEKLNKEYLKKHYELIDRNYDELPNWISLLADSCIMAYSIRKINAKVETIENRIYITYPELPSIGPKYYGSTPFWVKNPERRDHVINIDYYHVWFEKHHLKTDINFREKKINSLKQELKNLFL